VDEASREMRFAPGVRLPKTIARRLNPSKSSARKAQKTQALVAAGKISAPASRFKLVKTPAPTDAVLTDLPTIYELYKAYVQAGGSRARGADAKHAIFERARAIARLRKAKKTAHRQHKQHKTVRSVRRSVAGGVHSAQQRLSLSHTAAAMALRKKQLAAKRHPHPQKHVGASRKPVGRRHPKLRK
jgi:hypothetical protein